jgi:hypothetical protein
MIPAVTGAASGSNILQRWVAGGNSGALYTSDESPPTTWTSRTSGFGANSIRSVASDGNGTMFVAVGLAGVLTTSPDAITWTARTSSFSTTPIKSVAYGNGIWVAVGESGKIATATDPTGTWTQRTSGTTDNFGGIAYGGGIWVAVGRATSTGAQIIRTATDPTSTWTSRTSPIATVNASATNNVIWSPRDALFITGFNGGATPNLATSPDGITWTGRNFAGTYSATYTFAISFAVNGSTNVALFTDNVGAGDIESSSDGITWVARTPATTEIMYSAATDPSGLILALGGTSVGPVYAAQSSSSGSTWTSRTAPSIVEPRALCHSEGFR